MPLFDDFQRTDQQATEPGEPLYRFVNRAAGAEWQAVRDLLTEWLAAYPEDEQRLLISRFRRTDRRGFLGAFWELYLHELFRRLGFGIELHPKLVGTTHRPDFRLRRDDMVIYAEAVTVYEPQAYAPDDERLVPLLDTVNRIASPRFRLSVDARQIASTPLSLQRLSHELAAWLEDLEAESGLSSSRASNHLFRWQEGGWMLFIRPSSRDGRGADAPLWPDRRTRALRARHVDDERSIRQQITGKSRMYGQRFNAPFLIALTSYRPGHGPEAALRALFGPAAHDPAMMRAGMIRRSRAISSNGVWLTNKGVRYADISAVLTAFDVMPWSIAHKQPWLIANPWATHSLEIELPFNRFEVDPGSGTIDRIETCFEPRRLFELPSADQPDEETTSPPW